MIFAQYGDVDGDKAEVHQRSEVYFLSKQGGRGCVNTSDGISALNCIAPTPSAADHRISISFHLHLCQFLCQHWCHLTFVSEFINITINTKYLFSFDLCIWIYFIVICICICVNMCASPDTFYCFNLISLQTTEPHLSFDRNIKKIMPDTLSMQCDEQINISSTKKSFLWFFSSSHLSLSVTNIINSCAEKALTNQSNPAELLMARMYLLLPLFIISAFFWFLYFFFSYWK